MNMVGQNDRKPLEPELVFSMNRLRSLNSKVCEMTQHAGRRIMHFYKNGSAVTWKKDASPLTAADQASHEFLINSLQSLLPEANIVSEESSEAVSGALGCDKWCWLVDPLDGTKEFIKGTNEFTVNVALLENGSPILGVVHAPALSLTYYGGRDFGCWKQVGKDAAVPISTRRADSSQMTVVASRDHAGPLVSAMQGRLNSPKLQSMGSSLKFCLVGEGKADLYLRDLPTMEWDTAAAQAIVEAAGGGVYSLNGEPLRYGKANLKNPAIITVGDPSLNWRVLI